MSEQNDEQNEQETGLPHEVATPQEQGDSDDDANDGESKGN